MEQANIAQVKYYLLSLERRGVAAPKGIIEYPKQRRSTEVQLSDADRREIEGWEAEIERIVSQAECPALVKKGICKSCAFFEFCFV